jgi:hypothetical protein
MRTLRKWRKRLFKIGKDENFKLVFAEKNLRDFQIISKYWCSTLAVNIKVFSFKLEKVSLRLVQESEFFQTDYRFSAILYDKILADYVGGGMLTMQQQTLEHHRRGQHLEFSWR